MNRRHKIIGLVGAVVGLAATTGVVQQASSSEVPDLPSRDVREQAAYVVIAYELNGPYFECMQEHGWDIHWEWGIHLAPGLEDDSKLAATREDLFAKFRGQGIDVDYNSPKFNSDYYTCRRDNPAASDDELTEIVRPTGLDRAEEVAHWDNVMRRATQLGWRPGKPFGDVTPPGLVVD